MESLLSIVLIAAGSICAASFYVPIKKVKSWSWESYWIVQGIASWILAPWIFALFTVPELGTILKNSPSAQVFNTILFGALWGVGGLTFGLSMRYLGVAMGQSVALGFCAAFGTLIPPVISGQDMLSTHEGLMMILGVSLCIAGIAVVGFAGALKSQSMSDEEKKKAIKEFALKKGLIIAVMAGIMSACMNFGINGIPGFMDAGNVIQKIAAENGTNPLFVTNPVYIFVMFGGFLTNLVYCVYLNIKNKSYRDYTSVPSGVLVNNLLFSFLGGTLWFLQFFFFGMGQSYLPAGMIAFGWSMLMAMNIIFSNIWGIFLNEWQGANRKTIGVLIAGLVILILSTFVIKL